MHIVWDVARRVSGIAVDGGVFPAAIGAKKGRRGASRTMRTQRGLKGSDLWGRRRWRVDDFRIVAIGGVFVERVEPVRDTFWWSADVDLRAVERVAAAGGRSARHGGSIARLRPVHVKTPSEWHDDGRM